jgi:hypothetical protein
MWSKRNYHNIKKKFKSSYWKLTTYRNKKHKNKSHYLSFYFYEQYICIQPD